MNQASLTHLVSALPLRVLVKQRQLRTPEGPMGRLKLLRSTVTALVRYERIELNYRRADETRPYMERLISEALRYGDTHRPTMQLADFWLEDKALVPKLFKVLAPRYESWPEGLPYSRLLRAPSSANLDGVYERYERAVLELRGNPYPPLPGPVNTRANPHLLHNVLLEEARKEYFAKQSPVSKEAESQIQALPELDNADIDIVEPRLVPAGDSELEDSTKY